MTVIRVKGFQIFESRHKNGVWYLQESMWYGRRDASPDAYPAVPGRRGFGLAVAHPEAIPQLQVSAGRQLPQVSPTSPDPWPSAGSCGRFRQLGATYFAEFRNAAAPTAGQCRSICLAGLQ